MEQSKDMESTEQEIEQDGFGMDIGLGFNQEAFDNALGSFGDFDIGF